MRKLAAILIAVIAWFGLGVTPAYAATGGGSTWLKPYCPNVATQWHQDYSLGGGYGWGTAQDYPDCNSQVIAFYNWSYHGTISWTYTNWEYGWQARADIPAGATLLFTDSNFQRRSDGYTIGYRKVTSNCPLGSWYPYC